MPSRSEFFASLFDRQSMRKRYPHHDTALGAYLHDLGALPLLTDKQEIALLALVAAGDSDAVMQLVEANLRLVIAIAARFQGRGLAMLDLIQEGNLGLLKAIRRFDSSKTQRLSTYAKYWILSSIQRPLAGHGTLVHAPFRTGERLQEMKEVIATFEDQGIEPTPTKIAAHLTWPIDQVMELLDLMQKPLSLSRAEGDHGALAERIVAPSMFLSNDITSSTQLADVRAMISEMLTPKERLVIEHRFGLTEEGIVYEYGEIAAKCFQRTGPRADEAVRQLEKSALMKLRRAFEEQEA
jgi:RNA polymerase primary sigma factor